MRGEHHPDAGQHHVEAAVFVRQRLRVGLFPLQLYAVPVGEIPAGVEQFRRQVGGDDLQRRSARRVRRHFRCRRRHRGPGPRLAPRSPQQVLDPVRGSRRWRRRGSHPAPRSPGAEPSTSGRRWCRSCWSSVSSSFAAAPPCVVRRTRRTVGAATASRSSGSFPISMTAGPYLGPNGEPAWVVSAGVSARRAPEAARPKSTTRVPRCTKSRSSAARWLLIRAAMCPGQRAVRAGVYSPAGDRLVEDAGEPGADAFVPAAHPARPDARVGRCRRGGRRRRS